MDKIKATALVQQCPDHWSAVFYSAEFCSDSPAASGLLAIVGDTVIGPAERIVIPAHVAHSEEKNVRIIGNSIRALVTDRSCVSDVPEEASV